jgi:hypothetical protein
MLKTGVLGGNRALRRTHYAIPTLQCIEGEAQNVSHERSRNKQQKNEGESVSESLQEIGSGALLNIHASSNKTHQKSLPLAEKLRRVERTRDEEAWSTS